MTRSRSPVIVRALGSSHAAFCEELWQPKTNHKSAREIDSYLSQSPSGSVSVVLLLGNAVFEDDEAARKKVRVFAELLDDRHFRRIESR